MAIRFETEWVGAEGVRGPELSATWASLLIRVDDHVVTRVLDERAGTVSDRIHVPLYVLAEWLATNWWFLFHEVGNPAKDDDPAFVRRHALRTAREGYAFPDVRVEPAGGRVHLVWTRDRLDHARTEFLREGGAWIASDEFAAVCSELVDCVIRRLVECGVEGTLLQEEWSTIQEADAEEARFCRVSGGLGRDPYALDDAERSAVLGLDVLKDAVLDEAVAILDAARLETELAALVRVLETGCIGGVSLEHFRAQRRTVHFLTSGTPWDAGYTLARGVRRQLDLDGAPVPSTAALSRAIGEAPEAVDNVIRPGHFGGSPFLDGVVTSDANGRPAFAIRRGRDETTRRFQFCRGLAEALIAPGAEALLTQARSERQQRNRAFAAEFLAPSSGLRARVDRDVVDEDHVADLAVEFGVSPRLVEHQLHNHDIARVRSADATGVRHFRQQAE